MNPKQQVHAFIDSNDFMTLRQRDVKISELIRKLINNYVMNEYPPSDEEKIKRERRTLIDKKRLLEDNITMLDTQLWKIREERERKLSKTEKQARDQSKKEIQALKMSGSLRSIAK